MEDPLVLQELQVQGSGDPPAEKYLCKMKFLGQGGKSWICTECDYQGIKPNVRNHVESQHLNLSYMCILCTKVFKTWKIRDQHSKRCQNKAEGFSTL